MNSILYYVLNICLILPKASLFNCFSDDCSDQERVWQLVEGLSLRSRQDSHLELLILNQRLAHPYRIMIFHAKPTKNQLWEGAVT